jgi:hypothetical protein
MRQKDSKKDDLLDLTGIQTITFEQDEVLGLSLE